MKRIITLISLGVALLFTVVLYYENAKQTEMLKQTELEGDLESLKKRMLLQMITNEVKLPDTTTFRNSQNVYLNIRQLVNEGERIGLYIDTRQCTSCWKKEIKYLSEVLKKMHSDLQPFILAGYFSLRDQKMIEGQHVSEYPIFAIDIEKHQEIQPLLKVNLPFFFTLNSKGIISSIYYPSDNTRHLMTDCYFDYVTNICKKKQADRVIDEKNTTELDLMNSVVDLGSVHFRKKYEAVFKVKNKGHKKCVITNVTTSCSCVISNSSPNVIQPGEIGEFRVRFLSTTKGDFSRTLSFTTNLRRQPYDLIIVGTVL